MMAQAGCEIHQHAIGMRVEKVLSALQKEAVSQRAGLKILMGLLRVVREEVNCERAAFSVFGFEDRHERFIIPSSFSVP